MTTKYQTRNGAFDAEIVYTDEDARPNLNTVVKLTDRKTGRVALLLAYEGGRYNMDSDNGLDVVPVPVTTRSNTGTLISMIFSLDPLPPDLDDTAYPPSVPRLPFAHVWHWYAPQGHLEVYYYNPAIHPRRVVDSITIDRPSKALPALRAWASATFGPGAVHPRFRGPLQAR